MEFALEFALEVCVDRIDAAQAAARAGATRIEFNQALALDGLTPSPASCRWLVENCPLPIICMLRPHDRGFQYSPAESRCMLDDCETLLATGVAGIACGALVADGELDFAFLQELVRICGSREVVLHRVFDTLPSPLEVLPQVIDAGVRRILTSGGAPNATAGASLIKQLNERARGQIEILPAGGIQSSNVAELVQATGCRQVHGSFRTGGSEPDLQNIRQTRALLEGFFSTAK